MRLLTVVASALFALSAQAQETPRPLFPPPSAAKPAPAAPDAPIVVEDLPAPDTGRPGLAAAEVEVAGPLWSNGAPPELALLLRRLPTVIVSPTLRELQRALLAAPGPQDAGNDGLLRLRVEHLIAMGEAATALELVETAPEGAFAAEDELRLRVAFAAGRTEAACASPALAVAASPWREARLACAGLARDQGGVEAAAAALAGQTDPIDPHLPGLARAAAAGRRYALEPPVAADPLLLPLLRTVPIDLDPADAPALPATVRQALAENAGLSSAARAAVGTGAAPAPSLRPELNGAVPADGAAAAADVPVDQRARWAALVDGLGLAVPDAVWAELGAEAPGDPGPAPRLVDWRGFELAQLREQRGGVLLFTLLLLDGDPATAAPVTLRRALDALISLGLERDARALAAGTGGVLGL